MLVIYKIMYQMMFIYDMIYVSFRYKFIHPYVNIMYK